jgi:hypothetical protein
MLLTDSGGTDFQQHPAGTFNAVCRMMVDLGTQESDYQGAKSLKRQVLIGWETDEKMEDGKPFIIAKFYTASLSEKANLRHDLVSWRGREFTMEELGGFNARNLLKAPCMLSIVTTEKGKAKVQGISKLPKGLPPLIPENPVIYLSLDPKEYDHNVFDGLSNGIKDIIKRSPEWRECTEPLGHTASTQALPADSGSFDEFDDDLPF